MSTRRVTPAELEAILRLQETAWSAERTAYVGQDEPRTDG